MLVVFFSEHSVYLRAVIVISLFIAKCSNNSWKLTVEDDSITVRTRLLAAVRMNDSVSSCTSQKVERVHFHF